MEDVRRQLYDICHGIVKGQETADEDEINKLKKMLLKENVYKEILVDIFWLLGISQFGLFSLNVFSFTHSF